MADSDGGPGAPDNAETASIASTLDEEHDSDQEWLVNGVLAEIQSEDEVKYLIDWQGYPLWQASWEPKSNLSPGLLADWEDAKKVEGHSQKVKDNIARWKQAVVNWLKSRLDRHKERNRKRAERGMEPTKGVEQLWEESLEYLRNIPTGEEDGIDNNETSSLLQTVDSPSPGHTGTSEYRARSTSLSPRRSPTDPTEEVCQSTKRSTDSRAQAEQLPKTNDKTNKEPGAAATTAASRGEVTQHPSPSANKEARPLQQKKTSKGTLVSKPNTQRPSKPQVTEPVWTSTTSSMPPRKNSIDAPVPNVFVGGIKRKQRTGLLEAAKNPAKAPTPLNHHYQRILQKHSRDREDVVNSSIKPSGLLVLDPAAERQNNGTEAPSSVEGTPAVTLPPSILANRTKETATTLSPSDQGPPPEAQGMGEGSSKPDAEDPAKKKKKKRKSVRWDDNTIVQEPVEYPPEDSLFVGDSILPPTAPPFKIERPEPGKQPNGDFEMSSGNLVEPLSADMEISGPRSIAKNVKFGTQSAKVLSLTFVGLPQREAHSWVSIFEDEDLFDFKHMCTAKDFWSQDALKIVASDGTYGSLQAQQLCRGAIDWSDDDVSRDALVERLRLASFGLLYYSPEFGILLHPSRCEDWRTDDLGPDVHAASLSYIIFQPNSTFQARLLAPIEDASMARGQDPPPGARPMVHHRFFGLDYNRLIPAPLQNTTMHPFFLAFPNESHTEASFFILWLRSCNPDCQVFTSLEPQHWFSFVKAMRGIIIIHEDAVSAIRLFPGFSSILQDSKAEVSYWVFSKSLQSIRQIPDASNSVPGIGEIRLDPVFRPGVAILPTPSFIVAQPQQTYNLIKWYHQNYCNSEGPYRRGKLVLCGLAVDWFLELASEKALQRQAHPKHTLQRDALHEDAITHRFKTYILVRQMIQTSARGVESPVLLAPESIDGNDEQSLVNWFGWWTITNLGEYRKLTVIGSTETDKNRLKRRIRTPRFPKTTVGDPEEMYAKLDQEERKKQQESVSGEDSLPQAVGACLTEEFQFVPNDKPGTLAQYLSHVADPNRGWTPLALYKFPVSYWNSDMSFHFRDYRQNFSSYINCFGWFPPFLASDVNSPNSVLRGANTVAAFFYTIEGAWDPAMYLQDIVPKRRPWIAFHRPVNCFLKPWKYTELLIWDMTASQDSSSDKIYESDLIPAQRELIKFIKEDATKKNPTLPLKHIWLGGFNIPPSEYTKPLDVTLHTLDILNREIKDWVPAPIQKLPERGWKLVHRGNRQAYPDPMDIDEPEPCDESELKTVFHPPRRMHGHEKTRCKNRLFDRSRLMLRQRQAEMEYIFLPTMKWYGEQLAEGRGFEHIRVTTWETFFKEYKIPDPKKPGIPGSK